MVGIEVSSVGLSVNYVHVHFLYFWQNRITFQTAFMVIYYLFLSHSQLFVNYIHYSFNKLCLTEWYLIWQPKAQIEKIYILMYYNAHLCNSRELLIKIFQWVLYSYFSVFLLEPIATDSPGPDLGGEPITVI